MQLQLEQVSVQYPGQPHPAVHHATFGLQAGQTGVLLGPSGCGKTTLLRAIAGLERIQHGSIKLQDHTISTPKASLAPEKRRMGMVFQDYALFPHLTVADNVAFGLKGLRSKERQQRVHDMLELVGLPQMGQRYPHELSGGQQQRVALARALAPQPHLLLLDEPFSNLDAALRDKLAYELRGILKQLGTTAIMVTHDQNEAFAMGDCIGVLHQGVLQQWADARTLHDAPATPFVAQFIGQGQLLPVRVQGQELHTPLGILNASQAIDHAKYMVVRAHDITVSSSSPIQAEVLSATFQGSHLLCLLRLPDGTELPARLPVVTGCTADDHIGVCLRADYPMVTFA